MHIHGLHTILIVTGHHICFISPLSSRLPKHTSKIASHLTSTKKLGRAHCNEIGCRTAELSTRQVKSSCFNYCKTVKYCALQLNELRINSQGPVVQNLSQ